MLRAFPHDTLVGAGLDMLAEYDKKPNTAKWALRYTAGQAWTVLVGQRRSVASRSTAVPSYLWCASNIEEGEVQIDVDYGNLPWSVQVHGDKRGSSYINLPSHEGGETGPWGLMPDMQHHYGVPKVEDIWNWLFETGLPLGAPFILKVQISYHTTQDHWSGGYETDVEIDSEIIWVDPSHLCDYVWLPVTTPW